MYLPRLFSIVLNACLGETTIPLVSWAWGAFGISYTKKNHYNFASRCCEERQPYFYTKTWSWDVTWLFWRKFMTIRFFSDPVRVLSIGPNPIQVLLIRSDPVRVLSIRSHPIRSGPVLLPPPILVHGPRQVPGTTKGEKTWVISDERLYEGLFKFTW